MPKASTPFYSSGAPLTDVSFPQIELGGVWGGDWKDSSGSAPNFEVSPSAVDPGFNDLTGDYLDEGSQTSAEALRDENLGFLNQLIGSLTGENQKILQELQQASARAQYDYLERMSSSAYQRAVADMRKAGLNPAAMFMNGAGNAASTPSVQQAQVATENQLLGFFSSAGTLLLGVGSILNSLLGNLLPSKNINYSAILSKVLK